MGALVHVTVWERTSWWKRAVCAVARVALLFVLLALLIDLLGPPLGIFFAARWEAKKTPLVNVVPVPLRDYSVSTAPRATLSYCGYQFQVPWNAPFKQRASPKGCLVHVRFESGQDLLFWPGTPGSQDGVLTGVAEDKSLGGEGFFRPLFGDLLNRSAYDQFAVLFRTTPSSIRAFGPRAEAVRGMTLLTIKAIAALPGYETGAFSFTLPDRRGFQIGDPAKSRRLALEVFDLQGPHRVEIILGTDKDTIRIAQPELNTIVASLRVLSDSQAQERKNPLEAVIAALSPDEAEYCHQFQIPNCHQTFRSNLWWRNLTITPSGRTAIFVENQNMESCTSAGCSLYLFLQSDARFFQILGTGRIGEVGQLSSFQVLSTATSGYYDLEKTWRDGKTRTIYR